MNEERPVREFLKGCAVDIGVLAVMLLLVAGAIDLLVRISPRPVPPPGAGEIWAGAALLSLALLVFLFWVRLCVRALNNERRYHFLGLLSFVPLTLLFFGACTVIPNLLHP